MKFRTHLTRGLLTAGAAGLAAFLSAGALLTTARPAEAQEKAASPDRTVRVEDQDSLATVLKRLEGRPVKLRLAGGGEELSGKLQKVGKDVVHLSDLSGRDFYDAVVRIDQIAAVVAQARGR